MSGAPILVPILLPESLLQTNRFHRSWIQAVEQYEDFGTEEVSSLCQVEPKSDRPDRTTQRQVPLKETAVIQAQAEL